MRNIRYLRLQFGSLNLREQLAAFIVPQYMPCLALARGTWLAGLTHLLSSWTKARGEWSDVELDGGEDACTFMWPHWPFALDGEELLSYIESLPS